MKELVFEELSVRQKLGIVMAGAVRTKQDVAFTLEQIRNHAVGAVWVYPKSDYDAKASMEAFRAAADYPILFITDAESGMGDHMIGRHNALGCADSEELAYTFGRITAAEARTCGVNVVCDPILDMTNESCACGVNVRSIGHDKQRVAELAAAVARGLRDGGVLVLAKHYPGSGSNERIDSHMAESESFATKEELLDYNLYPYRYLMERGLLDGVMTRHTRFHRIDDYYPASLSKKVIGIIRDLGFEGICLTDALPMMGIVARFGTEKPGGLAINGGNDLALVFGNTKEEYEKLCRFWDAGLMEEEMLDAAVKRVLAAQHKLLSLPEPGEITPEEEAAFARINTDSIFAKTDDGVPLGISREGRHLFAILTPVDYGAGNDGEIPYDTMDKGWYRPQEIAAALAKEFPNSACHAISEFPSRIQNANLLSASIAYDDVVFVTCFETNAYIGFERFTPRILSLMEAMQVTKRVSTVLYFGNPFVLEDLPHIPRVIVGPTSADSVQAAIRVLAGEYPALGKLTYDVKLN